MRMEITFPGGLRVDAQVGDHTVHTDQPIRSGGEDTAAAPFQLFLASIGSCAGLYALQFCTKRGIPTDQLRVHLETVRDPELPRIGKIRLEVELPPEFPAKYEAALRRSVDQCAVKRHIVEPPEFEVALEKTVLQD